MDGAIKDIRDRMDTKFKYLSDRMDTEFKDLSDRMYRKSENTDARVDRLLYFLVVSGLVGLLGLNFCREHYRCTKEQ